MEDAFAEYRDDVFKYTVSLHITSSQDASDEVIGRSTGDRSSTGSSSCCAGGAEVSRGKDKEEVAAAGTGGGANMSLLRTTRT